MSSFQRSVLFVCLGNICRSPLAEGLFSAHVAAAGMAGMVRADSAGTSDWHVGEPPHARSQAAAGRLGIDISFQRCRQLTVADLDRHDLILGMDHRNLAGIRALGSGRAETALFLDYAGLGNAEVPDPWGGSQRDYEVVADLIASACPPVLARLTRPGGAS